MKRCHRSHCPVTFALDVFGDSWSLLVLRDLLLKGKSRFNEFLASDEAIATNILSARLASLEANGLITKSKDQNNRRQFIYAPTEKALDLLPTLLAMVCWSVKYDAQTAAKPEQMRPIYADQEGFIRALRQQFAAAKKPPSIRSK